MALITFTGRHVHTVAAARRLWCSARDRIARRHPLAASAAVVQFASGRAHVHALVIAPRPVPHRLATAQARAAGWGRIIDVHPVRAAEDAGRVAAYLTNPLAGAWAWPRGGKQLRAVVYSRSWGDRS